MHYCTMHTATSKYDVKTIKIIMEVIEKKTHNCMASGILYTHILHINIKPTFKHCTFFYSTYYQYNLNVSCYDSLLILSSIADLNNIFIR